MLWYVDLEGGVGKTWLAKYLVATKGAFYMQGGKVADVAHAYGGQEYVVCDFTRDKEQVVQYSAIEAFKNGMLFSPKYDSTTKVFKPAKVICFSNWMPDTSKLSMDRWKIKTISKCPGAPVRPQRGGKLNGNSAFEARRLTEEFDFSDDDI